MIDHWDLRFMAMAHLVASWSKDPSVQVGAVLVSPDHRHVSWGYNGFPRRVADLPWRLDDKEIKNELTVHAEMNAILNCTQDSTGWALYCTRAPCIRCCTAIIQVGVRRVLTRPLTESSNWAASCASGSSLLREAGVGVIYMSEEEEACKV